MTPDRRAMVLAMAALLPLHAMAGAQLYAIATSVVALGHYPPAGPPEYHEDQHAGTTAATSDFSYAGVVEGSDGLHPIASNDLCSANQSYGAIAMASHIDLSVTNGSGATIGSTTTSTFTGADFQDGIHFAGIGASSLVDVRVGVLLSGRASGESANYSANSSLGLTDDTTGASLGANSLSLGQAGGAVMTYATYTVSAAAPLSFTGEMDEGASVNYRRGSTGSADVAGSAIFSFEVLTPGVSYHADSGKVYATSLPAVPEPTIAAMSLAALAVLAVGRWRQGPRDGRGEEMQANRRL